MIPTQGLVAIVDVIGHDDDCPSRAEGHWYEYCGVGDPQCSVWRTAELIGSSEKLRYLLAAVWAQGFTACQGRVSKALLAVLPQQVDVTNPYSAAGRP